MKDTKKELEEAETILAQILAFNQYGAPAGISPTKLEDILNKTVEHFLRRDEPESVYYGRFEYKQYTKPDNFPDGCVCGQWSEAPDEVHMISAPCYYITED